MKRWIIIRTQFTNFHFWKDAPMEVDFLKKTHRHIFHVEAKIPVTHNDRQLEYFMVKQYLDESIYNMYSDYSHFNPMQLSCEQMAEDILTELSNKYGIRKDLSVSVFEDDENGSEVSI